MHSSPAGSIDADAPARELVGRDVERARLRAAYAAARRGHGAAIVVSGEPGAGKTALLDDLAADLPPGAVLRARPVEQEHDLAFSALADLLAPAAGVIGTLAEPRARALRAALALAPPAAGDRFAVASAALDALVAHAAGTAVAVLVDDLPWLDPASAEVLAFVARRVRETGLLIVGTVRDGEPTPFDGVDAEQLRLAPLDEASARELLRRGAGGPVDARAAAQVLRLAQGNPLALIELPRALSPGQLRGQAEIGETTPPGPLLERAYRRQLDGLGHDGRAAVLLVACAGRLPEGTLVRACRALGCDAAAIGAARVRGLVQRDGAELWLRHPLLRATVYSTADPALRRAAHRAIASALLPGDVERRTWHLAAGTADPDDGLADALEEVGLAYRARYAHASAASALEHAARRSTAPAEAARRLLAAAGELQLAGRYGVADALIEEALALACDRATVAAARHLQARAEMWRGAPMEAHRLLVGEAERLEGDDPARAASLLIESTIPCLMAWETTAAATAATRALALAGPHGDGAERAAMLLAHVRTLRGEPGRERALELHRRIAAAASPLDAFRALPAGVLPYIWEERWDAASAMLDLLVDEARAAGALSVLPQLLGYRSGLAFRRGAWAGARQDAHESVQLAQETGQVSEQAHGLVCLVRVDAAQGRADDALRRAAEAVELAHRFGVASVPIAVEALLGLASLADGSLDDAIRRLEHVRTRVETLAVRHPGVLGWAADLAEAYARAGHAGDARALAEGLAADATRLRLSAPAGAARRCLGLVEPERYDADFAAALAAHERPSMPFERARTLLCLGERLRRDRRPGDSRGPLVEAADAFDRLGASTWAERARRELEAGRPRSAEIDEERLAALTAQERQIADMVARGSTNREIASALFLSTKTIETHLTRIYRKLALRSRTELAALHRREAAARAEPR